MGRVSGVRVYSVPGTVVDTGVLLEQSYPSDKEQTMSLSCHVDCVVELQKVRRKSG